MADSLAPHWLPQVEGLRCSVAAISLGEDTKVIEPVGLAEIQVGGNGARNCLRRGVVMDLHTTPNNFAPNEYRGVVNSSGLAVYKGSTQEIIVIVLKVNTESKLRL